VLLLLLLLLILKLVSDSSPLNSSTVAAKVMHTTSYSTSFFLYKPLPQISTFP
jgi:hypothetical protein